MKKTGQWILVAVHPGRDIFCIFSLYFSMSFSVLCQPANFCYCIVFLMFSFRSWRGSLLMTIKYFPQIWSSSIFEGYFSNIKTITVIYFHQLHTHKAQKLRHCLQNFVWIVEHFRPDSLNFAFFNNRKSK